MKFQLVKAITFEDKHYAGLTINFDSLTALDLESAEIAVRRECQQNGEVLVSAELDPRYLKMLIVKAAKVPVELINTLSASDFTRLKNEVRNFLFQEPASRSEIVNEESPSPIVK